MNQTNKDIALMLWQGLEQVRLYSAFMHELKIACVNGTLQNRPIDIKAMGYRIDKLEAECDQVLQQKAIPAQVAVNHE